MIEYAKDETFDQLIAEGVVLVDFTATWCGPCKQLGVILEEIEAEYPFFDIVKVDVDACPQTSDRFNIDAIPHIYIYKDGKEVFNGNIQEKEPIVKMLAELFY